MSAKTDSNPDPTEANFSQTQWTVVIGAARHDEPGAEQALQQLCSTYWAPLYAFLRKQGRSPQDSEDLTQGFFAHLLSKSSRLENVEPSKGRFRSFLLASLNHYVVNQWHKDVAEKRGGEKVQHVPIQTSEDETTFGIDLVNSDTPDRAYDRCWAFTVINRALQQLEQVCAEKGESAVFKLLHPFLTGDSERGDYKAVAAELKKTEEATRVAVHRLKSDFRQMLRAEVGRTVASPVDADSEIRALFAASAA